MARYPIFVFLVMVYQTLCLETISTVLEFQQLGVLAFVKVICVINAPIQLHYQAVVPRYLGNFSFRQGTISQQRR